MPEQTKTRAQFVTEAAECLGIIGSGQSLEDEDQDKIDGKVDALLARLSVDGVVDISDAEEIPVEYFDALAELLANNCATKFGLPYSEEKKIVMERTLRRTASSKATHEVQRSEYF